jgi:hypothetical protein
MKIQKFLRPEKIIDILKVPCANCQTQLETLILSKEKGIPETSWTIVKCKNCSELNLLSNGPDVKEVRFGNYELVEYLRMDEFTREQALVRLEQIKHFRK